MCVHVHDATLQLAIMSRFWVEKRARKHRENMSFFKAKPYGPGLKTRLHKTKDSLCRCVLAPFSTQNLDVLLSIAMPLIAVAVCRVCDRLKSSSRQCTCLFKCTAIQCHVIAPYWFLSLKLSVSLTQRHVDDCSRSACQGLTCASGG